MPRHIPESEIRERDSESGCDLRYAGQLDAARASGTIYKLNTLDL